METQGTKWLDPETQLAQIEWIMIPIEECPDPITEQQIITTRFRVAHEPWAPSGAYVKPVTISRNDRYVLFQQESGII